MARLHICGNTTPLLPQLGRLGCEIIGFDAPVSMERVNAEVGPKQTVLGNLDPVRTLRDGTPESVYEAVATCHAAVGSRYIVGAGCEIARGTPTDNVLALTRYAKEHRP